MSLIVGVLGSVTENLEVNLGKIGISNISKSLQLSTVIETAIRKVLPLEFSWFAECERVAKRGKTLGLL